MSSQVEKRSWGRIIRWSLLLCVVGVVLIGFYVRCSMHRVESSTLDDLVQQQRKKAAQRRAL